VQRTKGIPRASKQNRTTWCREAIRLSWKHKVTDRLQHCGGFAATAFRTKNHQPSKETKKANSTANQASKQVSKQLRKSAKSSQSQPVQPGNRTIQGKGIVRCQTRVFL
jgi:hypothetical protein